MKIRFIKQGGHEIEGEAIGRLGSKLLIQYRITSGERRERWIPKARYTLAGDSDLADLVALPRFKNLKCKGGDFDSPLPYDNAMQTAEQNPCPSCGKEIAHLNLRGSEERVEHVHEWTSQRDGQVHQQVTTSPRFYVGVKAHTWIGLA